MDRAVASKRSNSKRLRRIQSVAWQATETLEKRMLLSAAPTINAQPLFIQNAGQWNDPSIKFAMQTTAGSILMTDHGPVFNVYQQTSGATAHEQFSVHFDGADIVSPTGSGRGGVYNYLQAGITDVKSYKSISYNDLYAGIDLQTFGQRENLKYEFHVAPGADSGQVQISYDGIQGLSIDSEGRLHIKTKLGQLIDDAPIVYQTVNGKRVVVESAFKLIDSNTYTFDVKGDFDPSKELVLDPSINWGTYLGGAAADTGDSVAINNDDGSIYITGSTNSTDFPVRGLAIDTIRGGNATDAYLTKFDVNGNIVWSTYFGGNAADAGRGVRLSGDGTRVFIAGTTSSSDVTFPSVAGATWLGGNAYNGGGDAFVAVLTSGGSLSFAGYFGGGGAETVNGVAVDSDDNFYITGATGSGTDFPVAKNEFFQPAKLGGNDAYIAKFDTSITSRSLVWASWFGGNADDVGQALAVTDDHVYLVGDTTSTGMDPVIELVNIGLPKDAGRDAFVLSILQPPSAFISPSLEWFRLLGGEGADTGSGIAVNNQGTIAITGNTASSDTFPTFLYDGADTLLGGNNDGYLALYSPEGQENFVTYIGGGAADTGNAMLLDKTGENFVLIGTSASNDLPFKNEAGGQFVHKGAGDAMYGIFDNDGNTLVLDDYGGVAADTGLEGAMNSDGGLYIVGTTSSTDLAQGEQPVAGVGEPVTLPRTNRGGGDAYVVFIALNPLAAAPTAPVNLRASSQPDGSILLTWGDTSLIEEGFHIYRSTSKTATKQLYTYIGDADQNATSYPDRDVDPGVTYYYYVSAYRSALERFSNRASATTGSSAIKAPSGLQATAVSGTRIDLKWTDNSTNETGFEVWRQTTSENVWRLIYVAPANSSTSPVTFRDPTATTDPRVDLPVAPLQPGTEYAYRVRAINAFRVSTFTDPRVVSTKSGSFIVAPSSLNATRTSATSVVLSWQDNSTNELGFVVERAPFGTDDFVALSPDAAQNATSFTDNTVESGQVYVYRVKAVNGGLSSAYSNLATSDLNAALLRPTRFEAVANSSSQIKLSWRDNSTIESGFVIERAQTEPNDWTVIGTAPVNATSFYDKRAVSGKRYYYRVRATDGTNFSGYSTHATDRALPRFVTAPRTPTDLRGKLLSNTSIRLVWRDNAIDETSYSIERSTSLDGGFTEVGRTDVNVNLYVDSGLTAGKTYYYRVRAINGGIRSSASNILKVKASLATAAKTKALKLAAADTPPAVKSSVFNTKKLVGDDSVLSQL